MPVTARNGGKRKSRNLKRKMLKGSAKKVLSKRYTRRKMRGGMKYVVGEENRRNLIYIWNSFLYDRLQKKDNYKKLLLLSNTYTPEKYALFVIDMQNDFVDDPYDREYNEMYDTDSIARIVKDDKELNLVNNLNTMGNFNVAQGKTMLEKDKTTKLQNLIIKINDAYKDTNCECIIFSRDYHPVDHMSFSGSYIENYKKNNLLNRYINQKASIDENQPYTGNFPAHCIECHNGSSFIPILITDFFNTIKDDPNNKKVKIVFKGIHKEIDSFSAVGKNVIDSFASNMNITENKKCGVNCANITGGYIFKDEKSIEYNVNFLSRIKESNMIQAPYNDWLLSVNNIEVCGLAGDYCVRDTIVALAEMYTDKQITLLQDLTRYAYLPVFTMANLPEHKSQNIYSKNDPKLLNITTADVYQTQLLNTDPKSDKGINYYIFKDKKLMLKDDIEKEKDNLIDNMFNLDKIFTALSYEHFITNHNDILDDYSSKPNIKILIDESNYSQRPTNA